MKPILPGSAIGVLGSGQLGRMFAIAARRMGYRVHTYSPDIDTPTGQVADVEITGSYLDLDCVRNFAANVDAVTFEFENVPAETAAAAAEKVPVRPNGEILHTTQHRLREKTFLRDAGVPVTEWSAIYSEEDLVQAIARQDGPTILKTADFGYDGKGQVRIHVPSEALAAWDSMQRVPAVLETVVRFEKEVSVIAARGLDGTFVHYGVVENQHVDGILDITIAPARVPSSIEKAAVEIARTILDALEVVGVLCVEFFVTAGGQLLVNELAPRPHNSGHFTFDACITSQFEQQLRAVCNLPLGSTEQVRPSAMANLLGDVWINGEPDWAAACAIPNIKLHLYGKAEPRPGRKMGHLTAIGDNAVEIVKHARNVLQAR